MFPGRFCESAPLHSFFAGPVDALVYGQGLIEVMLRLSKAIGDGAAPDDLIPLAQVIAGLQEDKAIDDDKFSERLLVAWLPCPHPGSKSQAPARDESLEDRIEADLLEVQRNSALVRSFFMAENVAYINISE